MQFKLYHERSSQVYSIFFVGFWYPKPKQQGLFFSNIAAHGFIQWIFAVHNMKKRNEKNKKHE